MGLFHKKSKHAEVVLDDPVVTYHMTQSLSGKLTVKPEPASYHTYSITLARPRGIRDTIDVAVQRSDGAGKDGVVGHCLVQVVLGRFVDCTLSDGTGVTITRRGGPGPASYGLETGDGRHKGFTWKHDSQALGGRTSADQRLKLEDTAGNVVARFAGAVTGVSDFGMLEIYDPQAANDVDWCGLLVLTAVCVYAREERNREKSRKMNNVAGFVGNWGGGY